MKIRELYSDRSKWTQNFYSLNENGVPTYSRSEEAVCWCLSGAVVKCYQRDEQFTIRQKIERELMESYKTDSLTFWNDSPHRKFEDVKALVEKLDV